MPISQSARRVRGHRRRARLIANPEDRRKVATAYIESVVGKLRGARSSCWTTVLMTVEETMDALRTAQGVQYRPPGA